MLQLNPMPSAKDILDQYFLEMRWRCLSLAADLDRVQRGEQSGDLFKSDIRLQKLHKAIEVLNKASGNRAEQVQNIFSDTTPPPPR